MRNRKEQEEAVKFLELHTNFMGKLDKGRCIRIPEENFTKTKESIKTVLNMLKENSAEIHQKNTELAEKNAEIEKYKKLLADNLARNLNDSIKAKEKADTDLDDLDKGWKVELEKKDKMIDLLIDYIDTLSEYYTRAEGKNNEFCDEKCIDKNIDCYDCIKQYFERKAEQKGE